MGRPATLVLVALALALALAGVGEARMLAALDCKGTINVLDAAWDDVALTMTGGEHILEALKEEQVARLTRCCPHSPKSAVEARADVMGSIVAALMGKTFEADRCLDSVGGMTIPSSYLEMLGQYGPEFCTDGNCGVEVGLGGGITLRAAVKRCANGRPAMALFCEGSGCNVHWYDGSCPAGFKPIASFGPSSEDGEMVESCGTAAAVGWKVLSRFLGRKVEGVCVPDPSGSGLMGSFMGLTGGRWNGGGVWEQLENGVNPLKLGSPGETKWGCNDVLETEMFSMRVKGAGKMVDAVAGVLEECMWAGEKAPFMVANGAWQPGLWLNGLVADPAGAARVPWGSKCSVAKTLFEGCDGEKAPPLGNVTVEGTSTLNYPTWAKTGFAGLAVKTSWGNLSLGWEKCDGAPQGLVAFNAKGRVGCGGDSDCPKDYACMAPEDLVERLRRNGSTTPAPTPLPTPVPTPPASGGCPANDGEMEAFARAVMKAYSTKTERGLCAPKDETLDQKEVVEKMVEALGVGYDSKTKKVDGVMAAPKSDFSFTTPLPYKEHGGDDSGLSGLAIGLIVGGCLVAVLLLAGAVVVYRRRSQSQNAGYLQSV